MTTQPIQLWGHWGAPNPWKVCIVLEELGLPYNVNYVEFPDTKNPSYLEINPNGRLPSIRDPNTGLTLWESGAIILYLIDQYDKDGKISFPSSPKKYFTQQWLAFQISGQGPYFGQAAWFARFHPEKIPSAIDRYAKEMIRVCGVLDKALKSNGTGWLVGDKCTYADLSFINWAIVAKGLLKELGKEQELEQFPSYVEWVEKLGERPIVKSINEKVAKERAAHNLK